VKRGGKFSGFSIEGVPGVKKIGRGLIPEKEGFEKL